MELFSNQFTTTINMNSSVPDSLRDSLSTTVNIYKLGVLLTAVNSTPSTGQYRITITGTKGCTASIDSDYKTIVLNTIIDTSGSIDISINIENRRTYTKSIPVGTILGSREITSSMSQIEQTAKKISWLIKGENTSSMTMTDEFLNIITGQVKVTADMIVDGSITADKINGQELIGVTLRNEDSSFKVDANGNIVGASLILYETTDDGTQLEYSTINKSGDIYAKDIQAETISVKQISADNLIYNTSDNPNHPDTLTGDINIYVSNLTGNDDYTLTEVLESYDEAEVEDSADLIKKFYSLKGVANALPLNLGGRTVRIYLETDDNGQVLFRNFVSGRILIFLCSHEVKGYIGNYNCYSDFKIYGGSNQNKPTTFGVIRPSTNTIYTSSADLVSVFLQKSPVCGVYYCDIYGGANTSGYSSMKITEDCKCRIEECNFYSAYTFVNVSSLCEVFVNKTTGLATDYAFKSYTGSTIHLANTSQANGEKGNAYWSNGSVIFGSLSQTIVGNYNITWDSTSSNENNTSTTPSVTTTTSTYKSTLGDTYRSTVYNNWKKDSTCRQGDWGYGDCTGVWFFGTQFSELKGKTITKVTITITRQSSTNGNNTAVTHKLWMHNHSTRPSGAPTLTSGWSTTFTLTRGQTKTITITDSTVLNAIKNGTCKGFAIRNTYSSTYYSVCNGSATVKITYNE